MCCNMMLCRLICWELFWFCCDKLEIKINYMLTEHMFIGRAASFIYPDEGSEFAKSILESLNCLDAFDLQCDYCIGEPLLGGCRLCIALWDE